MTVTYATTKQLCEFLTLQHKVVAEAVGTGDGSNPTFTLAFQNVITGTYTVYVAGTSKTEAVDYTIDKDGGIITFLAGKIPTLGQAVTATYWYANLSNTLLESAINRAEDKIDAITGHAWRTRYSGTSTGKDTTAQYIYRTIKELSYWSTGVPIDMGHRKIVALTNTPVADAIELWTGSWENILASGTEGRTGDFWVDYDQGILWLRKWYWQVNIMQVRMKYRYGEATVPYAIEDFCLKIAAKDLILGDDRSFLLPEGADNVQLDQKLTALNRDLDEYKRKYVEVKFVI
jgi:hypothetical protein